MNVPHYPSRRRTIDFPALRPIVQPTPPPRVIPPHVISVPSTLKLSRVVSRGEGYSKRSGHSTACSAGNLYLFGGQGDDGLLNDLYEFAPNTGVWRRLTPIGSTRIRPRYFHSLTAVPGTPKLVLFGGFGEHKTALSDAWVYDIQMNGWIEVPSGPTVCTPRALHSASANGGGVFVYGGLTPYGPSEEIWHLDTSTLVWCKIYTANGALSRGACIAGIPTPRYAHHAAFHGQSIFIAGGFNATKGRETEQMNDMWRFNILEKRWEVLQPAAERVKFQRCCSVAAGECWMFLGPGHTLPAYNLSLGEWKTLSISNGDLPDLCRSAASTAPLSDPSNHSNLVFSLFVTGGQQRHNNLDTTFCLSAIDLPHLSSKIKFMGAPPPISQQTVMSRRSTSPQFECPKSCRVSTIEDSQLESEARQMSVEGVVCVLKELSQIKEKSNNLQSEVDSLQNILEKWKCTICCDKPVEVMFLPCCHMQWCGHCSNSLTKCQDSQPINCPTCRAVIETIARPFLPS